MLSLGQRLRERYRVDALPDAEAGLSVYRGYDTVDNRLVAIKEFEGEPAARLEREAEALTLHRHPNLPVAYDAFMLEGRLYIVFEWPEGESLQARLKREGRLSEAEAVRYAGQILSALDYVHTLNLPIARNGFAPAHVWIALDGRPRLYAGVVAITNAAPYIAPEGGNDPRAAIYSAGAMLYNLLTGRSPEGSASPRKYNPTLSAGTTQAVSRALNSRPEARFATIRDMRKALGRAKATEAVEALDANTGKTAPVAETSAPPTPRSLPTGAVIGGVVTVVVLVLGAIFFRNGIAPAAQNTATLTPANIAAVTESTAVPTAVTPTRAASPTLAATATQTATITATATVPATATVTATATLSGTPLAGATTIAPADQMVLVYVPAGNFLMGSSDSDLLARGNEKPQHTVLVDSFWIDQTEVSNAQYTDCVTAKACRLPLSLDSATRPDYFHDPQYANYPVIWVNWIEADKYCAWAGRRLPTEAEWEKAARGPDGRIYPWGNDPPNNTLLNFNSAAQDTTAVGSFPSGASPYGALDMVGNVVEWVDGFYYDSYFTLISNTVTPTPAFHGGVRTLRSSSWVDPLAAIRAAARRYSDAEGNAFKDVGFRCAATAKP